jgi:Ser/Thr protein kinase RdoA (MazF antagonist)
MAGLSGIERAVFGPVPSATVEDWLDRLCAGRLGAGVAEVVFRGGRLAAVYGLRLTDGRRVAVKVHRGPVDVERLDRTVGCQRLLAGAGYPCPVPVAGPLRFAGHVAVIESLLEEGRGGDGHRPAVRAAMARALAWQVELLRSVPAGSLAAGAPAWTRYERGPWPAPHDPIFDFSRTPAGYEWLDALAALACEQIPPGPAEVIGHADWVCGNLRFDGDTVVAAYDWDSLVGRPEAVLVGFCAGAYTEGGVVGAGAPSPMEVAAFLADYEDATRPFSTADRSAAVGAATWVLAYNARCGVGFPDRPGSPLSALAEHRHAYLALSR